MSRVQESPRWIGRIGRAIPLSATILLLSLGCTGTGDEPQDSAKTHAGNGHGGASDVGSAGGTENLPASSGTGAPTDFEECAAETHEGKLTPLDLVIMLDHSSSMATKVGNHSVWQLVTGAISAFVQAPEAAGLGVGLQYFPIFEGGCDSCDTCYVPDLQLTEAITDQCCCVHSNGTSCATGDGSTCPNGGYCFEETCFVGGTTATCAKAAYAKLDVPIGALPANASAITASLATHTPEGGTPSAVALEGAIAAAKSRAADYPDHVVAVVFATDGSPSECSPLAVSSIASLAEAAFESLPRVRTFVIGIGDVASLDAIAQAGGTLGAFLISANGNAGQQFLDTMGAIHGSALACEFDIPAGDGGEIDYGLVNVQLTSANDASQLVPQVGDAGACGDGEGWYFDQPTSPTKIILCGSSCDLARSIDDVKLEIVFGCKTVVK